MKCLQAIGRRSAVALVIFGLVGLASAGTVSADPAGPTDSLWTLGKMW